MAPKLQTSPFMLFVAKSKRSDPSLHRQHISQLISTLNPSYEALAPEVRTQFERLSVRAKAMALNQHMINRELDKIDINGNQQSAASEDSWDDVDVKRQRTSSLAQSVGIGFNPFVDRSAAIDPIVEGLEDLEECNGCDDMSEVVEGISDLEAKTIVCISFNVYVVTNDSKYLPIEVGITRFSLKDGIQEVYTKLIANDIPSGYYSDAKEHSNRFHKISLSVNKANKDFESDYQKLFDDIYDCFSTSGLKDSKHRKLVFVKPDGQRSEESNQLPQVLGCLQFFDEQMKSSAKSLTKDFAFYHLSDLLFNTIVKCCQFQRPLPLCAEDLLQVKFDYNPEINCPFHESDDNQYCAQGVSKRMAYLFMDTVFGQKLNADSVVEPKTVSHYPKPLAAKSTIIENSFTSAPVPNHPRPSYRYHSDNPRVFESNDRPLPRMIPQSNQSQTEAPKAGIGRGRAKHMFK